MKRIHVRGVMNPDPESDFQLFGDSRSGFRSSKKWNHNNYGAVMILLFTRSGSEITKKRKILLRIQDRYHNTSNPYYLGRHISGSVLRLLNLHSVVIVRELVGVPVLLLVLSL